MSNASIDEIQELIQKLSGELGDMSEAASRHIDDLHVAVNNVASHVLAIEAVLTQVAPRSSSIGVYSSGAVLPQQNQPSRYGPRDFQRLKSVTCLHTIDF